MRHYEKRKITYESKTEVAVTCDGCGVDQDDAEFGSFVEVTIMVNDGEEFGGRNDLDFCDDCLRARFPALRAIGSTAPMVLDEDAPQYGEDSPAEGACA